MNVILGNLVENAIEAASKSADKRLVLKMNYASGILLLSVKNTYSGSIIIASSDKSEKEKKSLIRARKGQGEYRQKLLEECPYCPISMINDERLLIASHIKPWAKSDDKEKVDPKNGFALSPNYDCLFDNGFMTFTTDKEIIVSSWISPMNQKRLGIYTGMKVPKLPLDEAREKYMEYHRTYIYKG